MIISKLRTFLQVFRILREINCKMASRRSTPGLFELLQEADLSQFYNELRNTLRVCHVQQLKYVNEDDLCSIGMSKSEAQRLKNVHNRYCPPNYVTKLKKLLLPTWTKDEFLLDDAEAESVPSPPSTTSNISMPLPETVVQHQGKLNLMISLAF